MGDLPGVDRSERLHQSLDYLSPLEYAKRAEKCILIRGLIYSSLTGFTSAFTEMKGGMA